jgi:hypothetical protein
VSDLTSSAHHSGGTCASRAAPFGPGCSTPCRSGCFWVAGRPATLDELARSAIHEWLAELAAEIRVASTVWTRFQGVASALRVAGR